MLAVFVCGGVTAIGAAFACDLAFRYQPLFQAPVLEK
jgi:hypothetical protein